MLRVTELEAGYGKSRVLHGVGFELRAGEIVALLGRNGAGRSTTLKAIMGLVPARGGIEWRGQALCGRKPFEIARAGLGYVPENREVFPTLTVRQNLLLGERRRGGGRWTMDDMFGLFPPLAERRDTVAGVLSGGEQQMLALARTLMGDPELLLVDEPTEGLAPGLVERVGHVLCELRREGIAVLLVEQKLAIALEIADRCLLMGHGRIVFEGTPAALRARPDLRREWLEV
ncbi:MAG TPA: ABC transporter ATP-binding protein [Rubrivivax sp.]|nr:ABC transporter ATP-binding protein [Burkholderiales bacterium]HNT37543.1 ABC transporter ATP-binding protein [Rubrivivax sp.]